MPLQPETRELLRYLHNNPTVRRQIKAGRDKALLYAGNFFKPVWKEIEDERKSLGIAHEKVILPDVLAKIRLINAPYPDLLTWAKMIDSKYPSQAEWRKNGYIVWRALSGIFASNAEGAVSFLIGAGVSKSEHKVFAATEIHVLDRNPRVDAVTKDAIQYYLRCVRNGQADINTGVILG